MSDEMVRAPAGARARTRRSYAVVKRCIDLAAALLGLVLLWPVFLLVALAIRLDGPGPVLFRQERVGRGGKHFHLFKFRTMLPGARSEGNTGKVLVDEPVAGDDPAITRTGRILRDYGLDELPQLINIVRGDMSLVGPRPTIPEQVEAYTAWERQRLDVPPGITGLAQISGRNALDWPERIRLDLIYIERRSTLEDLRLLLLTARRVFFGGELKNG